MKKWIVGVGFVVLAGFALAACSSDGNDSSSDEPESESVSALEILGEPNPATGTPVKVGMITNGGDCPACANADEPVVAEIAAEYANEYLDGLAGHPMELLVCVDDQDAGKTVDCANEMIAEGVVAVVMGANGVIESSWAVLHDAGVPFINFASTNEEILQDDQSTIILQDPQAATVEVPIGVALDTGAEKVSVMVVDLPIATDIYDGAGADRFADEGLELEIIPIPLGQPDMTPQAQQVVEDNPDGVVMIVGHDAFCIPAINGLIAAGFEGTIATISNCVTDAMREAIPDEYKDGIVIQANAPIGDESDASWVQYNAVLDVFNAPSSIDRENATSLQVFSSVASLSVATSGLEGEVTYESVMATVRAMPLEIMPGAGERSFQCNGEASDFGAAICSQSFVLATLDAEGYPISYEIVDLIDN